MTETGRRPDFLLIGAQKAGTSWLWRMLRQHPGTLLPDTKELHYFGAAELYAKGPESYDRHFAGISRDKVTGEASTALFFDRVPYWYNAARQIEYDPTLPPLPELVHRDLPDARIIAVLRDPVRRAISAYQHWMRRGDVWPLAGLRRTAQRVPKLRILEYGDYARHLGAWRKVWPRERILVLVFEEDVVADPANGLRKVYEFLGLDASFQAQAPERSVHRSWSWTRSAVAWHAGPLRKLVSRPPLGPWLDRNDFLRRFALSRQDIEFLRARYLPDHAAVEQLAGRSLGAWDYGDRLLHGRQPVRQAG